MTPEEINKNINRIIALYENNLKKLVDLIVAQQKTFHEYIDGELNTDIKEIIELKALFEAPKTKRKVEEMNE